MFQILTQAESFMKVEGTQLIQKFSEEGKTAPFRGQRSAMASSGHSASLRQKDIVHISKEGVRCRRCQSLTPLDLGENLSPAAPQLGQQLFSPSLCLTFFFCKMVITGVPTYLTGQW